MKLFLSSTEFVDTEDAFDLSLPIKNGNDNVNAWYCDPVMIKPVINESFIGDTTKGGSVNFKGVTINPHGNGTHTECVGHISTEGHTINQCLTHFHFLGRIVSVTPKKIMNDEFNQTDTIIDDCLIREVTKKWKDEKVIIIRTLPNEKDKISVDYSGTNPTYFTKGAIKELNKLKIEHLMVDLPSVDREVDGGKLEAHHLFWNYPKNPHIHKTISELLFIPKNVTDGRYLIQIQIISIENDASPSKIMAHPIYNA